MIKQRASRKSVRCVEGQHDEGVEYCSRLGAPAAGCVGRACRTSVEAFAGSDDRERRMGMSAGYVDKAGERREDGRRGCVGSENRKERREERRWRREERRIKKTSERRRSGCVSHVVGVGRGGGRRVEQIRAS